MDSNSNLSNRNDPGAVTLGNFINYYQFHPPEERLKFLPDHLLLPKIGENYVCLDIGCNTGVSIVLNTVIELQALGLLS